MKKLITLGAAAALVFTMGTVVFGAETDRTGGAQTIRCEYTDTNGDGICDNGNHSCANYADKDNDGVCDNCLNMERDGKKHHSNGSHSTRKQSSDAAGAHHSSGHGKHHK